MSNPNPLSAIRLWLAIHRLSYILAAFAASIPQTSPFRHNSPSHSISPRIRHPVPSNQAAYDGWLPHAYKRVFRCEQALTCPIIAIEAPVVKGLSVYGARNVQTRFYGAWTRRNGIFVGWMRTRPNLAGETQDAVHTIGEILGRSVFKPEESSPCAPHAALESFRRALQEAAEDLGVD
jgi:hypothetical protein